MPPLDIALRKLLEKSVLRAREIAETGVRKALRWLGVEHHEAYESLTGDERELRRALVAKKQLLGSFDRLVVECAYEHWHRMLFARFLAENNLLWHLEMSVPITLDECKELAGGAGAADGWELASRYATTMLPQIFRPEDPLLKVTLALEDIQKLERELDGLPVAVFTADDSLGWVYQFWQQKRKDEINASGEKVGGDTIGPVTQLFTEPYMVQFLLHNTLGAWWVGRYGSPPPLAMEYLRYLDDGTPAAGVFPGWPETAKELRVLDPCCGSGHFLVAAFEILAAFRMAEEGLTAMAAGDAVLRDNLFGLDIDQRCTQIAAFALALAAWKAGGYRILPPLNVSCSGMPVGTKRETWIRLLAEGNGNRFLWGQLYDLFKQAPEFGSLLDPRQILAGTYYQGTFPAIQAKLRAVLAVERDDETKTVGVAAQGVAAAAEILIGQYQLVITNVPYLARGRQSELLASYCKEYFDDSKADLATVFVRRGLSLCAPHGSLAYVTPQSWLYLGTYKRLRERLLREDAWNLLARLGPGAFETISGEIVNVALLIVSHEAPDEVHRLAGIDATAQDNPSEKAASLRTSSLLLGKQQEQLQNPDSRVVLEGCFGGDLLQKYAVSFQGICTGDYPRFGRRFWELPTIRSAWIRQRVTPETTCHYDGCEAILLWENGAGSLHDSLKVRLGENGLGAWIRGLEAWGKRGIAVGQMGSLPVSIYLGECFDNNTAVIIPRKEQHLAAIWAFCSSSKFSNAVRRIDQAIKVTNITLLKVPFDLDHWQTVANEMGPLPEPYSKDPTQWLFKGHPVGSTDPLQVATARLLGYSWPEREEDGLNAFADADGIVCLPPVGGERPVADRLRDLLAAAYGDDWSPTVLDGLLTDAGSAGKSLAEWLRDGFFTQHCRLFHQRPFIWHIWDGRKDGFSALVNYHKLDRRLLERLVYHVLQEWIEQQARAFKEQQDVDIVRRVLAARQLEEKLKLILDGENPHDIFVRWKPLARQPIGWEPDLNDGVRLNIRPFMTANVLRARPNIKWGIDRGKNPPDAPWGEVRDNDKHLTLAEKQAAKEGTG